MRLQRHHSITITSSLPLAELSATEILELIVAVTKDDSLAQSPLDKGASLGPEV